MKRAAESAGRRGDCDQRSHLGRIGPIQTGRGQSRRTPERVQVDAHVENSKDEKENPLLAVLKAKVLPDAESQEAGGGSAVFLVDGKIKPKDLAIIYKGQAGKLIMEFANPK